MKPPNFGFRVSPDDGQLLHPKRVCRPIGRKAGVFPIRYRFDIENNILDLFLRKIFVGDLAGGRLAFIFRTAAADREFLFLVRSVERLCPIVAIALARTFRLVAAFPSFARDRENSVTDRGRYFPRLFGSILFPKM